MKRVLHFAHTFADFAKDETQKIEKQCSFDYGNTPVCDLWEYDEGHIVYKHCRFDVPNEVVDEVFCLTHHDGLSSKIFHKAFDKWKMEQSISGSNLDLKSLVELWGAMFEEFRIDFQALRDGLKLHLSKVECFFKDIITLDDLTKELKKWCDAVNEPDKSWIGLAAQKILDYQKLCRYSSTAQILMHLKETLGLTGNFSAVEAVLPKEKNADITLANVEMTAETADILKDIADVPHRMACLKTFCLCMSLVNWVRGVAKNVGQLQSFVQIANQTTEGDLEKQLLQDLLKFGSAFAPLIYDVNQKESCEVLISRCKSLWTFLDEHPNLIRITESCNAHLGEFKRIEESLSDFQKSNVEQMNLINTEGIYYIEAKTGEILYSAEDTVRLIMRTTLHKDQQKVFTLNKLRELRSKIVLVAAENADDVATFMEILSKIERISLLLIKLQKAGLAKYTHFHLECGCSEYKRADFNAAIADMEESLIKWQKRIDKYRKKYPHLNHYTSQQLLDMRKELGKLKKKPGSLASPKLKHLLLSVTSYPSQSKIVTAVNNAMKTMSTCSPISPQGIESITLNIKKYGGVGSTAHCLFQSLGEKQKQVYRSLIENDDFSEAVVSAAFSNLGEESTDEGALAHWCMENEHNFENEDDTLLPVMTTVVEEPDTIPEDDPLLIELLDEEYSLEIACEAVQKANGDPQLAREIAFGLNVGKSHDEVINTDWSVNRYSQFPLLIKTGVPEEDYLSIPELGETLNELSYDEDSDSSKPRTLQTMVVETGKINLIVVETGSVWKALLFLYMADHKQSLPTHEEVVICTEDTSVEEITLLWHRAINDEGNKKLFSLVSADKLPFKISQEVLNNLETIIQGSSDFRIVILISKNDIARSYVASRLYHYMRLLPPLPSDDEIAQFVFSQINHPLKLKSSTRQESALLSSLSKRVHVVMSTRSGMGKSLRIKRFKEIIEKNSDLGEKHYVNIPIHGPDISLHHILDELTKECRQDPTDTHVQLIHLDIAQNIVDHVDWLLFKILILGALADSCGNIWRSTEKQILVVECTLAKSRTSGQNEQLPGTYSLLSYFPKTICESPKEVQTYYQSAAQKNCVLMDDIIFKDESTQRVYKYLQGIQPDDEDRSNEPANCLDYILKSISSADPSWSEVGNFIKFLNSQLQCCENSCFCSTINGFKEFFFKFAVLMAKEFTQSSVDTSQVGENLQSLNNCNPMSWDKCSHPYLFFNEDNSSITFLGLWVNENGHLINYKTNAIMERDFMDRQLQRDLATNNVSMEEDYSKWTKKDMLMKLLHVLGMYEVLYKKKRRDFENFDPDSTYVLTIDNLMKMLAIHMKFRCGIPVIMMGETGCGKTRLLRYLCEVQEKALGVKTLICLKVHGGVNEDCICDAVNEAIKHAENNKNTSTYTVLFFDEVNTTPALGLIKEVMCDRTLFGKPIPNELKFAAACNPYRIHDENTIKSLQAAGLGFYLKDEETIPKLGDVPLRKLVYRVLPLPLSMYQYVYDFGTVSGNTEKEYIEKIVSTQLLDYKYMDVNDYRAMRGLLVDVFYQCQSFMRDQKNECKYVSLRDVVRAMILFKWFHEKLSKVEILKKKIIEEGMKDRTIKVYQDLHNIARALLYSISVGYYVKLRERRPFVERIVPFFKYHLPEDTLDKKILRFENEVSRIQTVFLNAMNVPSNIAHNAALRENIFMMVVCIENRLPLFIVGKPGSSKSLAKSIVSNSMQGRYSSNELLKSFKQIQLFPYQCNQFSTTDSLIEVFEEAMNFQKSQDVNKFASVVVLEEIGLAEDSPGLPLKVLHPYLEDGTSGINPEEAEIKPEERVAFIGISNWALDPAKMNRGIMVTRCSPGEQELVKSACSIASLVKEDILRSELEQSFNALAKMYQRICDKQGECGAIKEEEGREFFGLRDFYTMIKMLCWSCIDKGAPPSSEDYRHIILRNFSGHSRIKPLEEFIDPNSQKRLAENENDALDLINDCLQPLKHQGDDIPNHENRYILFITENQSALRILQMELLKDETPYIFYGSSFPKDTEYTQVFCNINKIKLCMEKGIPVVLLNYEQIYESLYDVLNQCYTELPTGRYVDLGLRSYRIKCHVHPNFRLIIIAERDRVFTQFPTALINRLEKHLLVSDTFLTPEQKCLARKLENWADNFCNVELSKRFAKFDSFVGYQDDTPSSIVLHVCQKLSDNNVADLDEAKILQRSVYLLLQTASVDAIARCARHEGRIKDQAFEVYFEEQQHFSMKSFISSCITMQQNGTMIQITTFGPLLTLTQSSTAALEQDLDITNVKIIQLLEFDTEMDFCSAVRDFYALKSAERKLLIVQSDYGEKNNDLLACVRHRLMDEKQQSTISGITHVLFVIQLPRVAGGTSFASFQGGPWISSHIDDLNVSIEVGKIVKFALTNPLHKFFHMLIENDTNVPEDFKVCDMIRSNIQIAVSRIMSDDNSCKQAKIVLEIFQLFLNKETDPTDFIRCLLLRIEDLLQQRDETLTDPDKWVVDTALDRYELQASYTLVNSIKKLINEQIQRMLAYIVCIINKNSNLDLLRSDNECLKTLWISLFSNSGFLPFEYIAVVTSNISAVDLKGRIYCCKFPFSYVIIDQVSSVFDHVLGFSEGHRKTSFEDLVNAVNDLIFTKHIEDIPSELSLEFYQYYLHDFIRNLALPFGDDYIEDVHQILHTVINEVVSSFVPAVGKNEHFTLLDAIVGVHHAYCLIEKEVYYLAQLCEGFPELPNVLKDKELLLSGKTVFHLKAVECCIDRLLPQDMIWNEENINDCIVNFHSNKSAIESILHLEEHDDVFNEFVNDLRSKWQRIVAVVLLAECVITQLPSNIEMKPSKFTIMRRYTTVMKGINFSEQNILARSIELIKSIITSLPVEQQANCEVCKYTLAMNDRVYVPCMKNHLFCHKCFSDSLKKHGHRCPTCRTPIPHMKEFTVPEKKRKEYQTLKFVQQSCLNFFMELVSQCCFSPIAPDKPSENFLELLLCIVTETEHKDYKYLFSLDEEFTQNCPIARSVLLQLLLEYNPDKIKKKLQDYQTMIKTKFGTRYPATDQELTLLCIKSMEDGLHKKRVKVSCLEDELIFGIECLDHVMNSKMLTDGDLMKQHQASMSIEFMQCIAKVRFGMCFAASIFHQYYCNSDEREKLPRATKQKMKRFRVSIENTVTKSLLSDQPYDFLIKQIVRQYGYPYLDALGRMSQFNWLDLPKKILDNFVVTGEEYKALRTKWIYSDEKIPLKDINTELKKGALSRKVAVVLRVYQHTSQMLATKTEVRKGQKELFQVQQDYPELCVCQLYTLKSDDDCISDVAFNPRDSQIEKLLADIVIHLVAVIGALPEHELFYPFKIILSHTTKAKDMYWPTMDDDVLDSLIDATAGTTDTWWKCPNGHDYFVQDCGRQIRGNSRKCFCGAQIGGSSLGFYMAKKGNVQVTKAGKNFTKQGHCLECPESRSVNPVPQRNLSPLSNCIIRLLVNSACVWIASSNNKATCQELIKSVVANKTITVSELLNYFWHHLEKDIQTLCRATQHSLDDCILLIHILLHRMMSVKLTGIDLDFNATLTSRRDRELWEDKFNQLVIEPVTQEIESHIEDARQSILRDSNLDDKKLFEMVYESASATSTNIMPHLWMYRPQITVDHVALSLSKETSTTDLRVLKEFLQKINFLRALKCLPHIVKLQTSLYELYHHRIDQADAAKPFAAVIKRESKLMTWAESFCSAWREVKNELPTLMEVTLPANCTSIEITTQQPLEFFLPMKQGKGACSVALASYLAKLQNDFIELAWEKLETQSFSAKHQIPMHKVQSCQMISFDDHLSHVIFSHCKYSLRAGKGADIKYDYTALEKHILDRFVKGKPLIACDIPLVSYRSDVLEAMTFKNIRNAIPQEPLPQREKEICVKDILRKQKLQESIDVINVALGFLQYSKSKPHILVKRFMATLKMERRLPRIIENRCQLCHIISLWRLVNVEQAKLIIKGGEDPFPEINPVFKKHLDDTEKETLQTALGPYDMDQFLGVFYEFIVTQVKSRQENEAEDMLCDAYIDVCDWYHLETIPNFATKFPKEFSLQHITEIWKYAVKYQQDQQAKHH